MAEVSTGGARERPAVHEISVDNLIFGRAWFVGLPLSSDWEWRRGPSLPEVDATIPHGNRNCVVSGRAWYALHDTERGYGCELTIDIRPNPEAGGWQRWSRGMETSSLEIRGHRVSVARGTARRGLFRPLELQLLRLQLACPHTERLVRIEFLGNPPTEVLDEIVNALNELRCH